MSNTNMQIEKLFLIARETKRYSSSQCDLLRTVEVNASIQNSGNKITANYRVANSYENEMTQNQNKLHLSYGL